MKVVIVAVYYFKTHVHIEESSTGKTTTPVSTHNCNPGTSQSNPETGVFDCSLEAAIVNTPLQHADRYVLLMIEL